VAPKETLFQKTLKKSDTKGNITPIHIMVELRSSYFRVIEENKDVAKLESCFSLLGNETFLSSHFCNE
jgi:hypothetical protein